MIEQHCFTTLQITDLTPASFTNYRPDPCFLAPASSAFCVDALAEALSRGRPEIFNSDQGAQFTSEAFTSRLLDRGVEISMDGRGRYMDNIFVERLWRSVKYEEVYLKDYADGANGVRG